MRLHLFTLLLLPLLACPGSGASEAPLDPGAAHADVAPPEGGIQPTEDVKVEPGTGVKVSGTFVYTGDLKGTYRIDISAPAEAGGPPLPVAKLSLPEAGPWEIEVPKNLGNIMVLGFIELGKGPGPDSPSATVFGLSVAETPIADVVLAPALGGVITGTPPGPVGGGDAPPPGTDGTMPPPDPLAPTDGSLNAADGTLAPPAGGTLPPPGAGGGTPASDATPGTGAVAPFGDGAPMVSPSKAPTPVPETPPKTP